MYTCIPSFLNFRPILGFPGGSEVKAFACNVGDLGSIPRLGRFPWRRKWQPTTHSSVLAWRIPWTEEPGGLQSTGSQRVGHDWATSLRLVTTKHWVGLPVRYSSFPLFIYVMHSLKSIHVNPFSQFSPLFPTWCPYSCSLHLCLYFCFANKIIYTIFLDSTYMH